MRAKFVNENIKFERGQDPRKTMNIGKDRTLPPKELKVEIFSRIWPKIKDDPFFLDKVDQEELGQELDGFVETIIDAWGVKKPSQLDDRHFREYWKDIFMNESVNFERGQNPKSAMEIGGVDFSEDIQNFLDQKEEEIKLALKGKTVKARIYDPIKGGTHWGSIYVPEVRNVSFNGSDAIIWFIDEAGDVQRIDTHPGEKIFIS